MSSSNGFDAACPSLLGLAYRVAFRVLGVREDAEDVAAETLARALVRWPRLMSDPEPWVVTVSARVALDVVRRRGTAQRWVATGADQAAVDPDLEQRLVLQQALLALPRRQREVVVLRYLADRSEQQTAAALGLSPGTVKSHSSRALAALRVAMSTTSGE